MGEIAITQEMIDAGSDELGGGVIDKLWDGWLTRDEVAERIISAALKAHAVSLLKPNPVSEKLF